MLAPTMTFSKITMFIFQKVEFASNLGQSEEAFAPLANSLMLLGSKIPKPILDCHFATVRKLGLRPSDSWNDWAIGRDLANLWNNYLPAQRQLPCLEMYAPLGFKAVPWWDLIGRPPHAGLDRSELPNIFALSLESDKPIYDNCSVLLCVCGGLPKLLSLTSNIGYDIHFHRTLGFLAPNLRVLSIPPVIYNLYVKEAEKYAITFQVLPYDR